MFLRTEIPSKKAFPCRLPWKQKALIFGPQEPEQGHFNKTALLFPLDIEPCSAETPSKMIFQLKFSFGVSNKEHNLHPAPDVLGTEKSHDSQRRDRNLRFFLRPEIGRFSPHFGAISLLIYTENLEKKGKKIHWRKFKEIQWRRCPEIADFLSLVVVERVLMFNESYLTRAYRDGQKFAGPCMLLLLLVLLPGMAIHHLPRIA